MPFLAERRQLQRLCDLLLRQGLGHVCARARLSQHTTHNTRHDTTHTSHTTRTLFVGEDEDEGVFEGVLLHYSVELVPRLRQPIVVRAVDHEYHTLSRTARKTRSASCAICAARVVCCVSCVCGYLRVLAVVVPQSSKLGLTASVPTIKSQILVLDRFHVEAWMAEHDDDDEKEGITSTA